MLVLGTHSPSTPKLGMHRRPPEPRNSRVALEVFDIAGRRVVDLVNRHVNAGYHSIGFNAANLICGVYFCRMSATGDNGTSHEQTRRFLLVR